MTSFGRTMTNNSNNKSQAASLIISSHSSIANSNIDLDGIASLTELQSKKNDPNQKQIIKNVSQNPLMNFNPLKNVNQ